MSRYHSKQNVNILLQERIHRKRVASPSSRKQMKICLSEGNVEKNKWKVLTVTVLNSKVYVTFRIEPIQLAFYINL